MLIFEGACSIGTHRAITQNTQCQVGQRVQAHLQGGNGARKSWTELTAELQKQSVRKYDIAPQFTATEEMLACLWGGGQPFCDV